MPPSLLDLPNELLIHILGFIRTENTELDLSRFSRCSRHLHAVATPVLYASIAVGDETRLLLRSLIRHPHLRSYTQSLTLSMPKQPECKVYFKDDADVKLLRATIEEILQDEVWHQQPPEGWCSGEHAQNFGANAVSRWLASARFHYRGWNAQFALLLALMPSLTHLEIEIDGSEFPLNGRGKENIEPDCIMLTMIAAANTQLRAPAVTADPARAPQDAVSGVLPRLRYVSVSGVSNELDLLELLPMALPPLVEELRVSMYDWQDLRYGCADCAAQMKSNSKTLVILDCCIRMSPLRDFLRCFPKLERLIGYPIDVDGGGEKPPLMLEVLESVAGTLKELDMSEDLWPFTRKAIYYTPGQPLCGFPVLEKLSMSAERLIDYLAMTQHNPIPAVSKQTLLGYFPVSLKELTITSKTEACLMKIVPALSYLLGTQEVPALRLLTMGLTERNQKHESVVDVHRHCEARGIGFAHPLVERMQECTYHRPTLDEMMDLYGQPRFPTR